MERLLLAVAATAGIRPACSGERGGGVRIEPVGFLVIRGERVELLTTVQKPDQWNQLSETLVPLLQQWLQNRAGNS